jgi:hypothetical protein
MKPSSHQQPGPQAAIANAAWARRALDQHRLAQQNLDLTGTAAATPASAARGRRGSSASGVRTARPGAKARDDSALDDLAR